RLRVLDRHPSPRDPIGRGARALEPVPEQGTVTRSATWTLIPQPGGARQLAVALAAPDRLALVVAALPAREPELDLGAAVLPVQAQRHEREAALGELSGEPADLGLVEQEAPIAPRIGVVAAGLLVGRDVQVHEQRLAAPHDRIPVGEVRAAVAE